MSRARSPFSTLVSKNAAKASSMRLVSFSLKMRVYSMLLRRPPWQTISRAACWALDDHRADSALKRQLVMRAAPVPCALDWHCLVSAMLTSPAT
eukprot:4430509-Pyramimonas_sp.AAC.1